MIRNGVRNAILSGEDDRKFSRFRPVSASILLTRPEKFSNFPGDDSLRPYLLRQTSQNLRTELDKANTVYLLTQEECFGDGPVFGIPEDFDHQKDVKAELPAARIDIALKRAGFTDQEIAAISGAPVPGGGDYHRSMNDRLLAVSRAKGSDSIYVVLDLSDGCGAGEVPVRLTSTPPFRSIRIIPDFFFAICEANGRDPWDERSCPMWKPVVTELAMASGRYRYLSTDPDAKQKRGYFTVGKEALENAEQGNAILKIGLH